MGGCGSGGAGGGGARGGGGGSAGGSRQANPIGTEKQQRAAELFISRNQAALNSERGVEVASNNFSYANASNERMVQVMNSLGRGQYEVYTRSTPGTMWTNYAPVRHTYIRRKR